MQPSPPQKRAIFLPVGSHGDVLPAVGLAQQLMKGGVECQFLASPAFESTIRRIGAGFTPLGEERDYLEAVNDPLLHHPTRGVGVVARLVGRYHELAYRELERLLDGGPTVLVGTTLAFALRCLAERHHLPCASLHLSPAVLRSRYDPPTMSQFGPGPSWLPPQAIDLFWWLADRLLIDPLFARPLNDLREKLGLKPVRRVLGPWLHQADLNLGLFPDWFCPTPRDWPPLARTDFPLYDVDQSPTLEPALLEFLEQGPAPVVFTGGTGFGQMKSFYQSCVTACQQQRTRGILLTRHDSNLPELPPSIRHFHYAPFSQLLPRCAALVHHGGIGTLAQAVAAGIPQIVVPQSHDQFDNAYRIQRLGLGRVGREPALSAHLGQVLYDKDLQARCRSRAGLSTGLPAAADKLLTLFTSR